MALTHREPSVIRGFLEELRSGRLYVVKVSKGGKGAKYGYLNLPVKLIERYGRRFDVKLGEGYVDYIADPGGEYRASPSSKSAFKIRFPVDVSGYVIVEPQPYGFRVYY